jgi:hypothetical protein
VNQRVEVLVKGAAPVSGVRGQLARLRTAMDILNTGWPNGWSDILIEAAQEPSTARADLEARHAGNRRRDIEDGHRLPDDRHRLNHLGHLTTCVPALK